MSQVIAQATVRDILSGRLETGTPVVVKGWVRTRRDSKAGLSFIHLHDGSCFAPVQVVAPRELPNYETEILRVTAGCSLVVQGHVVESQGKGQSVEMQAASIEIVGWVDDPDSYPIQAKHHSFEYLREVAHLRSRTNTFGAIARVRHTLASAIHRYYGEHGFLWIHTPIITASDCEGAGELFGVSTLDLVNVPRSGSGEVDFSQDFFGRQAFLTVSGQLNVETYAPSPALWRGLRRAAAAGAVGETVLMALLALGEPGPAGANATTLGAVVEALGAGGLEAEARALALEAVLAATG